jgi:CheY-like chemotaxis protein
MRRILIADDSRFIREQLRGLLEQRGAEVYEAKNGEEAVSKSERVHPDLVVMDCQMPVMDGLQAARQIHRSMPEIPVVMFALDSSAYLAEAARKSGIKALFPKTKFFQLLNWIEREWRQPSPVVA